MMPSENMSHIILEDKTPTPAEHYHLRKEAGGLTAPPQPENEEALKRSFFCVTLRDTSTSDNKAVGMGRIVGDGMFLFITDMAILPAYQRKGLGGRILDRLIQYVDETSPKARLSLEADPPGVGLYKSRGFKHQTYSKPMLRSTFWPSGSADDD